MSSPHSIAIIGAGNLGEAVIGNILSGAPEVRRAFSILNVIESDPARRDIIAARYGIVPLSSLTLLKQSPDLVILAIKPQDFNKFADQLNQNGTLELFSSAVVLSMMAGVRVSQVQSKLKHKHGTVRAMPNLAAKVGAAISTYYCCPQVNSQAKQIVQEILGSLGTELEVQTEELLDVATAIAGSGPGFFAHFIERFIVSGIELGFSPEQAQELVLQTFFGTAELLKHTKMTPEQLRVAVTSPNGTTHRGLVEFNNRGLENAISGGISAAFERAKELSSEA